ncbi:MAG: ATP-binding protein [Acidobacteriota bacterium]
MVLASLTNRIFLASAALLVVVIGSTAVFVSTRVRAEAERELSRGLIESGAVVDRQSRSLSDTFTRLSRLIADLPKLKAAVATADPPTVRPLAAEYRDMLPESSFVTVTDRAGRMLANIGPGALPLDVFSRLPSLAVALSGRESMSFHPHPAGVLQVLTVPITVGREPMDLSGTLSIGFVLDNALAGEFKGLTGSDIAFGLGGAVRASTMPRDTWASLAVHPRGAGVTHLSLGADDYVALTRPLGGPTRRVTSGAGPGRDSPFVVVLRSQTARLRFLGRIQTFIAAAALIAVLLATILSYAVARTITRPLGAITTVMREVAATGDLTRKIPLRAGGWEDEDARLLASTFNTLTESIAVFERDAAHRERLSSLGRLSSVVAHEVRNPLMIIKAALRALRREDARPEAREEALQDIDGEVARLNRIVSEVLDYARPITFHWQRADVNDICRDSAQAAQADEDGVPIRLALAPGLPEVVSDPDRLRSALVNVLTNARHAVIASASGTGGGAPRPSMHKHGDVLAPSGLSAERADPATFGANESRSHGRAEGPSSARPTSDGRAPVELCTEACPGGGIRIWIRDRGIGIDPAVLPRVFEPYFTTRRGGTGLGLAIVRNIVEGLGGRITIESDPDTGTSVRIELPLRPAGRQRADFGDGH